MCPRRTLSFHHQNICSRGVLCVGCVGPTCCDRLTTVGGQVGLVGPWSGWLQALPCAGAASCWLAGPVMRQLTVESWGTLRLVLAHWCVDSGSRRP